MKIVFDSFFPNGTIKKLKRKYENKRKGKYKVTLSRDDPCPWRGPWQVRWNDRDCRCAAEPSGGVLGGILLKDLKRIKNYGTSLEVEMGLATDNHSHGQTFNKL